MTDIVERLDLHTALTRKRSAEAVGELRVVLFEDAMMLRDAVSELRCLREAVQMMSVGANHIASMLIRRLGGGFAHDYPPHMSAHEVLEKLGAGDTYDAWCCWSAAMRSRDVIENR